MLPFEEAEKIVREIPPTEESVRIPLPDSIHSVLAEDIIADMNMPPFNKSAVDGFACKKEDLGNPIQCLTTIAAGTSAGISLKNGYCARIMTGAEVPAGGDCVIMLEDTQTDEKGNILYTGSETPSNICYAAEDVSEGEILLPKGSLIKPRHIPILASMGYSNPLVYKKPTIGIISTGSELVDPSQKPSSGKIRNSNGPQLETQCTEIRLEVENFGIIPDSREKLREAIRLSVSRHTVSLISGGVSVGDFDFVPGIIKELGFEQKFYGLNVKPGKRIIFASKEGRYIFGLPGNPVSAMVQFEMLVKPLLLKFQNALEIPGMEKRFLAEEFSIKDSSKLNFVPVLSEPDGVVNVIDYHGSAHIFVFTKANGFMKIPIGTKKLKKGALVDVRFV